MFSAVIMAGGAWPMLLYRLAIDGGILALWVLAGIGWGSAALRAGGLLSLDTPDRPGINFPLWLATVAAVGWGGMSLVLLGLGLTATTGSLAAWALLIGGVALVPWRQLLRRVFPAPDANRQRTQPGKSRWLWLIPMPLLGIAIVAALVPPGLLWGDEPAGYDVVEYHLQIPREWYESGRITPLNHNVFSYFPFNAEMHDLLAMHLRGGAYAGMYLAQLMHLAMMAFAIVAIYGAARCLAEPAAATIAAAATACVPWIAMLAPIAYNESALLLFCTLSIGWVLQALTEDRASARAMVLGGIAAGLAFGTKLTAIPLLGIGLTAAVLLMSARRRAALWTGVIAFLLAAGVTAAPWLARNAAWTGNPVFPEALGIFGPGGFTPEQADRWHAAHSPRPDQRPLLQRGRALIAQVFGDFRYGWAFIPATLIAAAIAPASASRRILFGLLVAFIAFWMAFTHLQGRFLLPVLPVGALLIASVPRRLAMGLGIATATIGLATGLGILCARLESVIPALGMENLSFMTPAAVDAIPADANLALIGDARTFVYQRPMSRLSYRTVFDIDVAAHDGDLLIAWAADAPPGAYRLVDPDELARFSRTYRGIPRPPDAVLAHSAPFVIVPPGK